MDTYIHISIPVSSNETSDILVAFLGEIGFEGFQQEPKLLQAFIPAAIYDEKSLTETIALTGLPPDGFSRKAIAPRNWNAEWEKDYPDVRVGAFCRIRAPFHEPDSSFLFDILITPKMSFGTGHHATTYMMIDAMLHLSLNGKKVLDLGTGTGVLAILAQRSGATEVRAIDNDAWSIENATENVRVNGCDRIVPELKDSLEGESVYDVILANINLRVILEMMPVFGQHLTAGGVLLGSGVLESDEERIRVCATDNGFLMSVVAVRDNWMSFTLRKSIIS